MSPKQVVFKKASRDKSVAVYLAKRDFVDHCDIVDPVDGVIFIDPVLLQGKKVYVMLSCTFWYGRQDEDVMGVAFRRDLFLVTRQVYPELQDKDKLTHTKTQQKLLRKLGDNGFPFFFEKCAVEFEVKAFCGQSQNEKIDKESSVRLSIRKIQFSPEISELVPSAETTFEFLMSEEPLTVKLSLPKEKCAVEFEVKAFCGQSQNEKIDKESSVRLSIRKIQFSPEISELVPSAETTFEFLMSEEPLTVKLSLPKETFYHSEPVTVNVDVTNSSSRNIKDISVSVEQVTNVVLYSNDKYVKSVAKEETNVKQEVMKEVQGILVSYKVVLRMMACGEPEDMVFEEFKRVYLRGVVYGDDDESPTEA
ncbi:hypothetical protein F2P81_017767 [Scophthalmus maximus]|uniref:S-arrestin n=1 Tax=Scophthalmus maximus TaxID=52904 RepID=A0A6A4S751_SCOMX|nr:hypothetical protein F2P81_017767 [Scophthalmus maximus]